MRDRRTIPAAEGASGPAGSAGQMRRVPTRIYAMMGAVALATFGALAASYEMYAAAARPFA